MEKLQSFEKPKGEKILKNNDGDKKRTENTMEKLGEPESEN